MWNSWNRFCCCWCYFDLFSAVSDCICLCWDCKWLVCQSWINNHLLRRRNSFSATSTDARFRKKFPTVAYSHLLLLFYLAGHRFDNTKGLRRRKISHHSAMASVVHLGNMNTVTKPTAPKRSTARIMEHHKVVCCYWIIAIRHHKKQQGRRCQQTYSRPTGWQYVYLVTPLSHLDFVNYAVCLLLPACKL